MDQALWQRVLNLVKKTGDRLVIVDPEKGDGFVLLPLDAYEAMVGSHAVSPKPAAPRLPEDRPEPQFPAPAKVFTMASDLEPSSPAASIPIARGDGGFFENDSRELEERYYLEPLE